jgi:hypothetical protein
MGTLRVGTSRGHRWALVSVCTLPVILGGGCESHAATSTQACPAPPVVKVVVASERGAVGMARVGLTPRSLKAEEKKC